MFSSKQSQPSISLQKARRLCDTICKCCSASSAVLDGSHRLWRAGELPSCNICEVLICHKAGRWSSAVSPAVSERSPEGAAPHPDAGARLPSSFFLELFTLPGVWKGKYNPCDRGYKVHFRGLQPLEMKRCSQNDP